jgi:hypothetical protein
MRVGLTSGESELALYAATFLLELNDLAAVPIAEQTLLRPPQGIQPFQLQNLRAAVAHGLKSVAAIPFLDRLAASDNVQNRRAAISSLANIDDQAALRGLARALDDYDELVRYHAVRGLAVITGERNRMTTPDKFRVEGSQHVAFWRDWVKIHRIIR